MGGADVFQRMGNVYRLLVDEKARAEREGPMLLAVAEMARRAGGGRLRATGATRVLDLACGTGIHARLLGRTGYAVTALDSSAAMLAEARRFANPASVTYAPADLLEPLAGTGRPVARPAALALLLGNTLSVFASDADLRAVFRHVGAVLLPGGLLLVQTLNYARLRRSGGSAVVRHGRLRGRETVVTKSLQPLDDGRRVLLTLAAAQAPAGRRGTAKAPPQGPDSGAACEGWTTAADSTVLRALAPEEIVSAARETGLRLREAWGGPAREPFDEEKSTDFVALFVVRG